MLESARVLVVDDDESMAKGLAELVSREGHEVRHVLSAEAAVETLATEDVDLVLSDMRMSGMDGMGLLEHIKKVRPLTEVVIITGYSTVPSAVEALRKGAFNYLAKPFQLDEVRNVVRKALDRRAQSIVTARKAEPYQKLSRKLNPGLAPRGKPRPVVVGNVVVGGDRPIVIAGPCAVETRDQTLRTARAVKAAGGDMLRGGVYKPRTTPYDFQGLGPAGYDILREARAETGLPIVTELMDPRRVEEMMDVADVFQIGTRNMQNYILLTEAGKSGKPVLLKRGMSATLKEWLCAAEYIAYEGNLDIILCERGIRTFSHGEYSRNSLDLNVIEPAKKLSILPVIVDPSHGTGKAELVPNASYAAIGHGANGLLIEVIAEERDRCTVQCDAAQAITAQELAQIVKRIHSLPAEDLQS
ncbi:MAG: 3-deoxy-7-phosphoheptulonate synthase [Planctomycetota bacterium]